MPDPNDPNFRLSDEFSEGPQMDLVGPFKPPDNGGIAGATKTTNNYMVGLTERDAEQKLMSQAEMKTEMTPKYPGGWTTFSGPSELMNRFAAQIKKADSIDQNYERMIMEKQARIDQQKPWANALATIAGSLAANDPNPITRGLGQAAQQLNPTRAQLQAQQMQLLQGQAQAAGQGLQAAEGMARMGMNTGREKMDLERQKAEETKLNRFMESMRRSASGGRPVPIDAFMAGAIAEGFDQSKALSLYQLHKGQAEAYGGGKADAETRKISTGKTMADYNNAIRKDQIRLGASLNLNNRLTALKKSFELATSDDMLKYKTDLKEAETQIALDLAESKEGRLLGTANQTALAKYATNDLFLGTMRQVFSDPRWAKETGAIVSYNSNTKSWDVNPESALPIWLQDADRVKVRSFLKHEVPRIITLIQGGRAGGVSLVSSPAGQKLMTELGASKDLNAASILAIEPILREVNNTSKAGIVRAKQDAFRTGKYDTLLGVDDPFNEDFWKRGVDAFGKPMSPILPKRQGETAPVASEPTATGPNGEKMVFRGGKWQPLK